MVATPQNRRQLLAAYAWGERRLLLLIVVLTFLSAGAAALPPLPVKLMVDYALRGAQPEWLLRLGTFSPAGLITLAAGLSITIFVVSTGLEAATTWTWSVVGQRLVTRLTNDLFAKLLRLTPLYHTRMPVGDSITRLSGDTWCIYTFLASFVMGPVHQILMLVSAGFVAFSLDSQLAWVSLAVAPMLALSNLYFGARMKARAGAGRQADADLLSFVQQTLTSLPLVQAFAAEDRNRERFGALANRAITASKQGAWVNSQFGMVNGVITTAGTAIILLFGGTRALTGGMPVGTLLVFLAYIQTMQAGVENLLKLYGTYKPLEASIDRILQVLESQELVPEPQNPSPLPDRNPRGASVSLEHVCFGYQPGVSVLDDVSLEAAPGERIAFVGHSGAGKSTLISLLPRLLDPWSGMIKIDGIDVRSASIADVRARISILLQEPFLFPVSIAENIAFGRPGATREQIVAAAASAGAHSFITALPEGYDTVLSERGTTLSGGQRQRIAIARAFLKNAPILILDEPTSALDAHSERDLLAALDRLAVGRTAFIIAHRLSTIRNATRIYVIEDGRVVESGTHEELLLRNGAYARYYASQTDVPAAEVPA